MTLPGNRSLLPSPGYRRIYSDAQESGVELTDGQLLPVSNADEARIRFNRAANRVEVSVNAGVWLPLESGEASVATRAALSALPSAGLVEGDCIYCYEPGIEDIYVLDTVGAHVVDGLTVLAAADGGYWVARLEGRWDDLQGSVSQGTAVGALTYENYRATAFKMNFFRHDQDDELSKAYQMPHRWRYVTEVIPHLHIVQMSDPIAQQQVLLDGYYHWVASDSGPIPDVGAWTPFSTLIDIDPGEAFFHKYAPLGTWAPPAAARESTILLIYMRRHGTDITDTYDTNKVGGTVAANLGLLSADVHFRATKFGTETPSPTP